MLYTLLIQTIGLTTLDAGEEYISGKFGIKQPPVATISTAKWEYSAKG
ncbi:MAG: hypothetical protein FD145_613 [Candidatus Saganbacteria bacterium]|uniref:Uncharacterized protein n=1 Tax=Candidatus Saganbacteria bacterium TaxID=2575572 RepID=A0A833L1L6_UNCSA|nr:MAG: hypothetical protein FD145_613 [Candidatus Saganbacteria bacterium]